ncbi:hypothetical protein Mapa_010551 [Marchantia paleacea]|nr:hypothetical protein Mapa_010551 [Marchantia paleacea]
MANGFSCLTPTHSLRSLPRLAVGRTGFGKADSTDLRPTNALTHSLTHSLVVWCRRQQQSWGARLKCC